MNVHSIKEGEILLQRGLQKVILEMKPHYSQKYSVLCFFYFSFVLVCVWMWSMLMCVCVEEAIR